MKRVRILLFILSITAVSALKAQCIGDFTWVQNGTTISFYGSTSPNITAVVWDFGDGNYDYTNNQNPNHTYAGPGTYTVCMGFTDSVSCVDSTCHTIVIDSCYATLNYTQNGNTLNFMGYANGSSANTVYTWNFGDNSPISNQQNPTYTYSGNGIYTVCFSYHDSTTGCSDSICTQVQVGSCFADFTSIDSMGYAFFVNTSSMGSNGVYTWDFGDGFYSTQYNPSHIYMQPGIYLVCLTVYDSLQNFCDSTCHYIDIYNLISVNEKKNQLSELTLAPNPSDGNADLSFFLNESATVAFSLYDVYGRTIKEIVPQNYSAGKQTLNLNTTEFSSGVYFIRTNVNGQITNTRMVVAHPK